MKYCFILNFIQNGSNLSVAKTLLRDDAVEIFHFPVGLFIILSEYFSF